MATAMATSRSRERETRERVFVVGGTTEERSLLFLLLILNNLLRRLPVSVSISFSLLSSPTLSLTRTPCPFFQYVFPSTPSISFSLFLFSLPPPSHSFFLPFFLSVRSSRCTPALSPLSSRGANRIRNKTNHLEIYAKSPTRI